MRRPPVRRSSTTRRAAESRRRLEVLETRSVMAVTCALADGTLTVCGTDPSDQVALVAHGEGDTISVLGKDNSILASYSAADVQQIQVQSAGGADAVRYDAALASLVNISDTSSAGVAAPAAPVRTAITETLSHQHGATESHSSESHTTDTHVAETPVQESAKSAAPVAPTAQMLVSLTIAPSSTATYSAAGPATQNSSNITVATDSNSSAIVHSHGSDGAQALSAAPTAGDTGHEGHGGTDGVITSATAAAVTATSITNPIVSTAMSGTTVGGGRSSSGDNAKSCELKTSFKGTSRTLYTKYECKCDEKRWASKRRAAAAAVVDDESAPKNLSLRGPLSLIWDGGYDTCTDSNHALDEFERMQQEYADEAAEAVLPVESRDEAPAAEAGADYFQLLGMSLLSVGVVGLAATRIPSARKRDEEEERALFLSLELLSR